MRDAEKLTAAYIEALYFTETGDVGQPPADAELSSDALARIRKRCEVFWRHCGADVLREPTQTVEQAGHDLWLTSQSHGAGFWDGDWPLMGEELTRVCDKFFNTLDVYLGDDGKIHLM